MISHTAIRSNIGAQCWMFLADSREVSHGGASCAVKPHFCDCHHIASAFL
jgi:hypothetical protein